MNNIAKCLLLLPLWLYLYVWSAYIFNINLDFGIVYDDTLYRGDGVREIGLIPANVMIFLTLIGTPLTFIIGAIYTVHKKYWGWLLAYSLLGGLPICVYVGSVLFAMLFR